jgi:hypothetical protein
MTANKEMADVVIVGGEPVHTPHGLIVTVDTSPGHETNVERLHRNVALQNSLGIPARVVNRAELRELQPQANWDDVSHAAYPLIAGMSMLSPPRAPSSADEYTFSSDFGHAL